MDCPAGCVNPIWRPLLFQDVLYVPALVFHWCNGKRMFTANGEVFFHGGYPPNFRVIATSVPTDECEGQVIEASWRFGRADSSDHRPGA